MAKIDNKYIAIVLNETADLMEIAGLDGFRIRSYRTAAVIIESHPESIQEIIRDPERDITAINGIGKGIKAVLEELLDRGSFERRDELLKNYPATILELLKIPGMGPKSVALIHDHYHVNTIDDLERLCTEKKLRPLPGMGKKLEERVLRGIESYKRGIGRHLLSFADSTADEIIDYLSKIEGLERLTVAGSLRRGKETIGDLDLLAVGPKATTALEHFLKHPSVVEILVHGETKASVRIGHERLQVDVRALPTESYGAALQYFTGSKEHNVALRERAVRMGFRLNEYGLFRDSDGEKVAGSDEAEIYEKLGLRWVSPELRENKGEIEAALKGHLPDLVTREEIQCDVHMHTTESDGRFSLELMAKSAEAEGHKYMAITDHSKSLAMANGLDEKRLLAQIKDVRRVSSLSGSLTILSGCEVDILRDGQLDIDDEVMAQLDVVIASIHSYMNLEPAEMTDRLLRVLENPHVGILGHPTGRLLLRREPYRYDFERIAVEVAQRGICMEINASPERLDLDSDHLRLAKSKGVKFVISTDAHHIRHLANMKYGVSMARRGWLEASDVLNTLNVEAFRHALKRN